jgi:histidine kinase
VLEYIEGKTLKQLIQEQTLDFESIYKAAIQIAQTLDAIHEQNIIHKDISSNNILHDQIDNKIKIIDFGISTRTNLRNEAAPNINKLEGTLAYLSPEQTGRMNRSVDYRTDFYSLGAVIYEMSTGIIPFDFDDSLQMVYAHLAKEINPASKQNPECPASLCAIVSKLMSKNAEDRYQSAKGLLFDLNHSHQLFKQKKNAELFELGAKDHSGVFQIPEKSYGREKENQLLLDIFDKVANGNVELVLVEGPSGTGKSRLVAEVNKPITNKRGFFISGKFDQLQKDLPYSAFVQAFESLVRLLLAESEELQEQWKEKILANVGSNGKILTDIIPKLELLIGKQPDLAVLEGVASQNRFEYTLKQFVLAFCKSDHPLVLFLDDLQWVDQSSLRLIEVLLSDLEVSHLMMVCSYRDNEVTISHPFYKLTEKLKSEKNKITTIKLSNLSKENLNELLCDAFLADEKKTEELSNLIYSKSKGNIFFIHQFLNSISENNLLRFDHETTSWLWDVKKISELQISDNIVDLMMNRISLLPSPTVTLLSTASCIGNSFDLPDLMSITGKTAQEISAALEQAIENGLITSKVNISHLRNNTESEINLHDFTFRFVHDRVQQTFYLNLNDKQKQESHLNIGKLLLKTLSETELNSSIFEVVNHLNLGGAEYQVSPDYNLCELNLKAGKKARNSAAFEISLQYLRKAIEKLPADSWVKQYTFTLELHNLSAESAYLSGEMDLMEKLVKLISENAKTILDQAFSYEVRINAYNAQNELLKQVMVGVEAVNKLGVKLPTKANKLHVVKELIAVKMALRGKTIESLADLPEMSDPNIAAAHSIMTKIGSAAMYAAPDLLPVIAFRSAYLSIKYGNTVNSAFSYTGYAMILCGALGDIENGFKFGEVALKLAAKTSDPNKKVRPLELFYSSIAHWKKSYRSAIEPLYQAYRMGVESGDFEFASYSINNYLFSKYFSGYNLYELNEENEEYIQVVKSRLHHKTAFYHGGVYAQAAYNLITPSPEPWIFTGPFYNEAELIPKHKEGSDIAMLCMSYYNKFTLAYYYGNYEAANEYAAICKKHLEGSISQPNVNLFHFYFALNQLAQNKTSGVSSAL